MISNILEFKSPFTMKEDSVFLCKSSIVCNTSDYFMDSEIVKYIVKYMYKMSL